MKKIRQSLQKTLLMAFLLCCTVFTAGAYETQGLLLQNHSVSLSYQSAPVSTVTGAITQQTGVVFSYESSLASVELRNVNVKGEMSVEEMLSRVFSGSGISYSLIDKVVVLKQDAVERKQDGRIAVSGTVTDSKGEPVVAVGVLENGNISNGVVTDALGRYAISVKAGSTIEFSSIGFEAVKVPVNGRSVIDVEMKESNTILDEVVVVGYGTQSRRTLTSSVSRVSGETLQGTAAGSIGDALKGKISGVRISSTNNAPGEAPTFLIRGGSSINQTNAPIVIVDGVQHEMTGLNPNDIESIEILKDAASAGIYGANASNGVVLITTKKGSKSKGPQISFETQAGWESPATRFDLMNGGDYLTVMRQALSECPGYTYGESVLWGANSAGVGNGDSSIWTPRYLNDGESVPSGWKSIVDPVNTSKTIIYQDNDQQGRWFSNAIYQNYYVGVNGGNDKVTYAASAGYLKDGGIGINTDYSRFTFHGNTSFKVTKDITATTVFDYSDRSGNTIPDSGIGNYWTILGRGMFMPTTHRDFLADGTPAQGTNNTTISALWFDKYYTSTYMSRRATANFNLDWKITPDFEWYAQVADHNMYSRDNQYLAANAISSLRTNYERWGDQNRLNFQTYGKFNKDFGKSHLDAMLGYDYTYRKTNAIHLTTTGAVSDKVPTTSSGTTVTSWGDTQTPLCQESFFGRLNFDYAKRYLFTLTAREDASSLFAAGHRWGFFPAASAGWVISSEPWWSFKNWDTMKLRLSYGLTGNSNIGYYDAYGSYATTSIYDGQGATISSSLPNLALTWESTRQFDAGIDFGFYNGRIQGSLDGYSKVTKNLLFDVTLPNTSGYGSATQNIGSVLFYGAEFELHTVNVSTRDFSWKTDFTYSFNMNRVLSLPDEYRYTDLDGNDAWRIGGYTMGESGYRFGGTAVGERLGRIYGYKVSYIIESEAQANAALYDSSSHGYRRSDGKSVAGRKDVGDYEWCNRDGSSKNSAGDEIINGEDVFLLGYVVPHTTGGLNNTFSYKNLSLSVYLDYALGHSVYNYQYTRCFQTSMGNCNWNLVYDATQCWKQPGDKTIFARLTPNDADGGNRNYSRISNINVQKGDYLCLRDVTLAYDIPKKALQKIGVAGLQISVTGNTLGYLTAVKGVSPESASTGTGTGMYSVSSTSSSDFNNYPPTRKVLLGIKLTF